MPVNPHKNENLQRHESKRRSHETAKARVAKTLEKYRQETKARTDATREAAKKVTPEPEQVESVPSPSEIH